MDQPKMERMLRLMALLSSNIMYTVGELADKLGMSSRTIYRYLDTFKEAGFSVEKVSDYVYRLTTLKTSVADLSNIVHFSDEEAYIVHSLIDNLDNSNTLKAGLKRKLAAVYDSTSIADYVDRRSNARLVQTLAEAMKERKVVVLEGYASSHSGETKDYRVEPFDFTSNYVGIWAYDTADRMNKQFTVLRMTDVRKTEDDWAFAGAHHAAPMDAFRIHGQETFPIVLKMNNRARNLMVEEYPLTERDIRPAGTDDGPGNRTWIYDGLVRGMNGIGRFVLGLSDSITVVEGDALKAFLRERAEGILENT